MTPEKARFVVGVNSMAGISEKQAKSSFLRNRASAHYTGGLSHLHQLLRTSPRKQQFHSNLEHKMKIRRMVLDVDKAIARPTIIEIGSAIEAVPDVNALNITVTEIDIETVGMDITIEGECLDYDSVVKAIESTGAVVHSIDELVSGNRLVERVGRVR
jgi:hypothetical protein